MSSNVIDENTKQLNDTDGIFTAKELSEYYGISSATLRTRWYPWLEKAVGENRLKVNKRYTELSEFLFTEYKECVAGKSSYYKRRWVNLIKERFPHVEINSDNSETIDNVQKTKELDDEVSKKLMIKLLNVLLS